jgi:hypothetical protein
MKVGDTLILLPNGSTTIDSMYEVTIDRITKKTVYLSNSAKMMRDGTTYLTRSGYSGLVFRSMEDLNRYLIDQEERVMLCRMVRNRIHRLPLEKIRSVVEFMGDYL